MTRVRAQRRDWEDLAQVDPLWAIASAPGKRFGRTDREAFYASGERKVQGLMERLDGLGLPTAYGRALDFGCGAGRITLPLADRFEQVVGVDIAPTMLDLAHERAAERPGVEFRLDADGDQSALAGESFDLVYTGLVLQHLPTSEDALACLGRLAAAVAPGGALVAQIPTWLPVLTRMHLNQRVYGALRSVGVPAETVYRRVHLHPMRMTAVARERVDACLREHGLELRDTDERRDRAGVSLTLYAVRS
jgi:SAM-dependent methyltransferase